MYKVLFTEPFTLPTPAHPSHYARTDLTQVLAGYGVEITEDPESADLEVRSGLGLSPAVPRHLPNERMIIVDGEPPQPEFILPYYREDGFADVISPTNLRAYHMNGTAYLNLRTRDLPELRYNPRILQLSTFRTNPSPRATGVLNGKDAFDWRVLCTMRCQLGLSIRSLRPELIDLCGSGWPEGTTLENSRGGRWNERKLDLLSSYGFNLCWENMEIPYYTTEKLWDAIAAGTLPLYWGPSDMHDRIPPDTIIDCRNYEKANGRYDIAQLVYDVENMSALEWTDRVLNLREWMLGFPEEMRHEGMTAVAHDLGRSLQQTGDRLGKRSTSDLTADSELA